MTRSKGRLRRWIACAGLGVVVAGAACGDDEEGTTSTGSTTSTVATSTTGGEGAMGGGGQESCGPVPGQPSTAECKACTVANCCVETKACADDPLCSEVAACLESCGGDSDCVINQCDPLVGMGFPPPAFFGLQSCQVGHCKAECSLGPFCDKLYVAPDADPSCGPCREAECCDEAEAAFSVDWFDFAHCQSLCLDSECLRECELRHPSAITTQNAVLECVTGPACAEECESDLTCGLISFAGGCGTCAVQNCCDPFELCSQSVECIDFLSCWVSCGTQQACAECSALWPPEIGGTWFAGINCIDNRCDTECGVPAPGCGFSDQLDSPECTDCLRMSCCTEGSACGEDVTCQSLKICVAQCDGDTACEDACEAQFPGGVAAHDAVLTCKTASCTAACP